MNAFYAIIYREAKIRATNVTFLFWDLVFPIPCELMEFANAPDAGAGLAPVYFV